MVVNQKSCGGCVCVSLCALYYILYVGVCCNRGISFDGQKFHGKALSSIYVVTFHC